MANTTTTTPIVYYGGKTGMLPHLLELVPIHKVYTETFFGGGALFWGKKKSENETINDKLDLVVNFYRVLKSEYKKLKPLIDSSLVSRSLHNQALTLIRMHKNHLIVDRVQLAWAFWLCTNFAFANKIGGGYKYSNHQTTPVAVQMIKKKSLFTEHLVTRIQNATIENDDALKVLRSRNTSGAFHYLDPPYADADQGHYRGFSWEDQDEIYKFLANECKGKFLLSGYPSDMLTNYINDKGWYKKEVTTPQKINTKVDFKYNTEILVWNYVVHESLEINFK